MDRNMTIKEFVELHKLRIENTELKEDREKLLNSNTKLYEELQFTKIELAEIKSQINRGVTKEPTFTKFLTDSEKEIFNKLRHKALNRKTCSNKKGQSYE